MKKTVTVSIPVYNGEKFILDSLQSIANQTVKVDKIIICDNQSNDNTVGKINKFINDHKDYNIELFISKKNLGYIKNFKKCYELAKTDYLIILHVDDLLKTDTVEKQLNFFSDHPDFSIVGGKGDRIDSMRNIVLQHEKTQDLLFSKNEIYEFIKATASYIPFSTVMYNLKLTNDVPFFEEESLGPDELYWPKLLKIHPIAIFGESVIDNRIHKGQAHVQNAISKFDENILHLKKKLNKADLENTVERRFKTKKVIKKQIAKISIRFGKDVFKYHKNFKFSFKYFIFGIRQFPGIIFSKYFYKMIADTMYLLK